MEQSHGYTVIKQKLQDYLDKKIGYLGIVDAIQVWCWDVSDNPLFRQVGNHLMHTVKQRATYPTVITPDDLRAAIIRLICPGEATRMA